MSLDSILKKVKPIKSAVLKSLFAGACLALPFFSCDSDKRNIKIKEANFYNISQAPLEYSDLMRYVDPKTKLPNPKYLTDKPRDFTFDKKGSYISKQYRFDNNFFCSMFFAVQDINYTKDKKDVEVKLNKYPKYLVFEIPHIYYKEYVDEAQDGIDGKNEKEANFRDKITNADNLPHYMPVSYSYAADEKINLYESIKKYLDPKTGLPKTEFLTDKPLNLCLVDNRIRIAKQYVLDSEVDEKGLSNLITSCLLYFNVNDADFIDKGKKEDIVLKLNPNPISINFSKGIYTPEDDNIVFQSDSWFFDPKMDSINGNEELDEEYFKNQKKKEEKKPEDGPSI